MIDGVAMLIIFLGIVAGALICWHAAYSDGYEAGYSIGRAEGVAHGLRRANIEMRKGSDDQ